nr:hypothetical protein CPGR_00779 [Mycolicibacter nonchromogenicus]
MVVSNEVTTSAVGSSTEYSVEAAPESVLTTSLRLGSEKSVIDSSASAGLPSDRCPRS